MKLGNRKNREIDRIGKAILAADRLREDEIEQIARAPHLLAGIRARIDAEWSAAPATFRAATKRASVLKAWMVAPAAVASVVLLAGLFMYTYSGGTREDVFLVAPPEEIENAVPETSVPAELPSEPAVEEKTVLRRVRSVIAVQASAVEKPAKRPAAKKKPADQPLEFYALSSAGDPAEMLKDGRIIRVDLPRTSLLSLGVNVPLESENAVVKTDLLVGSDGVTKAIRVVK